MKISHTQSFRAENRPFWLSAICGATIAVYADQFLGSISAFSMLTIRSLRGLSAIDEHFNPTLAVYGGVSGLIESIVLIVLAIYVIRQNDVAKKLILWALPIFIVHSIVFLSMTGQLGGGAVRSITTSFILWVAFVYLTRVKRGSLG